MQDSITKAIVAALRVKLSGPVENAGANAQGTKDLAAYDAYLQGRYLFAQRKGLDRALKFFDEATQRDPNFARAYAAYAMAGSLLTTYGPGNPDSIIPLAVKAGERAVALDPNLADGHLGLANSLIFELKWKEALAHLKRAIELEPSNPTAHQWYGDVLHVMGRSVDALPEGRRAVQLDPASPVMNVELGYNAMIAGRLDEAEKPLRKGLALDPTFPFARTNIMAVKMMKKQYDSVHVYGDGAMQPLGVITELRAYIATGDTAKARVMRDSARSMMNAKGGDPTGIEHAFFYAAIDKSDSAFVWINHAIDVKSSFFFTQGGLPCDPRLIQYRADPRFAMALHRLRIEPCQAGAE
jgi:tetratricopeptide (TPR) repeat protein